MPSARTWLLGTRAAKALASAFVPSGGDLVTTRDGGLSVGDGSTALSALPFAWTVYDLPPESGFARVTVDQNNRVVFGIATDGRVIAPKLELVDGSIAVGKLSTALQQALPSDLPIESGFAYARLDAGGRLLYGVQLDGTFVAKGLAGALADGSVTLAKLAPDVTARLAGSRDHAEVTGTTPNRKVWLNRDSDGARLAVTDGTVDSFNARAASGGAVFDQPSGTKFWQPWYGNDPRTGSAYYAPMVPNKLLACYGDSFTASFSSNLETGLSSVLGVTVDNRGVSGQQSGDIRIRFGAGQWIFTVAGGAIPADGSTVTLTMVFSPSTAHDDSIDYFFPGTLAGIAGTIKHSAGGGAMGGYSFTPTAAPGSAVPASGNQTFTYDQTLGGAADWEKAIRICSGRNNVSLGQPGLNQALIDIAAMVSVIRPYTRRFYVVGITNRTVEPRGSAVYNQIVAFNATLAATYAGRWFDQMRWAIDSGLAAMGFTATAQDLIDIGNDVTPNSLRNGSVQSGSGDGTNVDALHFAPTVFRKLGTVEANTLLVPKGWFS